MTKIQTPSVLNNRKRLAFLAKDSVLYGGAAAVSKSFSLITFPLLASSLSVSDYGAFDYFSFISTLLLIFCVFGQDSAVARFFYLYENPSDRRQLASQSLVLQLIFLAFLLPILWQATDFIIHLLVETHEAPTLFKIILLQIPFLLLLNFSQNLLKWSFSRIQFLTLTLGSALMQLSLLLIVIVELRGGIVELMIAGLVGNVIFGVLGLWFVRGWLAPLKGFNFLREMLPFAIPYGIICVVGAFLPTLERNLTFSLLGGVALGEYAVAFKLAMLVNLIVSAFQTAWGPFSLSIYKEQDAIITYNWVFKIISFSLCLTALSITLLAAPIINILAINTYANATIVVFPLVMCLVIQASGWISEIGIGISKRSYLSIYSYIAGTLTSFGGIVLLTPLFGLLGVGLGSLLGYLVKAVVGSWFAQRSYPMQWNYKPVISIIFLTLFLGLLAIWTMHSYNIMLYNIALCFSIAFIFFLGWFTLFSKIERKRIISIIQSVNFSLTRT